LAMLVALPTMAGCKKTSDEPETPVATDEAETTEPADDPADSETPAEEPMIVPADAEDGSSPALAPNAPTTLTVRLAWVEAGENALGVERSIPYTQAVATASMNALLAGPTPEEQATWPAISTAIPAGTKLLGLSVANGVARVDLSKEFESGGGTFGVTARLAQVVYTLTQFPTIQAVEFYIEGVKVEMFSTEGLILEGPQTIEDYENLLPMDA
ncbi:hypothetical protein EG835_13545, partial [bacterium]|nr:hypothetical protein [bacterium]